MDIALIAMEMKQAKIQQQVSIAITKQAMDLQVQTTENVIELLDAPHPTAGHTIDFSV